MQDFALDTSRYLLKYGFDGLDLNWEYPASGLFGSKFLDRHRLSVFVEVLRETFNKVPGGVPLLLTATVSGKKYYIDYSYNVRRISPNLDFMNVVAYDYSPAWERLVEHSSALYSKSGLPFFTANYSMTYWAKLGAPKSKLNLGVPFYARTYTMALSADSRSPPTAIGNGIMGQYTRTLGFMAFYEVCHAPGHFYFMVPQMVPMKESHRQRIMYDNIQSIGIKAQYVRDHGFGGLAVWSLGLDDFFDSCHNGTYPLVHAAMQACFEE